MTELEKKEINEIFVTALKGFLENVKPMPVPAETMSIMSILYGLYTLGCPRCCHFSLQNLNNDARDQVNVIGGQIRISEEEVISLAEQRVKKRGLLFGINGLAIDLKLDPVDISPSPVFREISDKIKEICDKIGLNEEEVLNLAEQRIRKRNIESEINDFANELKGTT
jgi:hypothetical protein